jgi:dihydroorotate dehydrogenase electron transfer subunit
MTEELLTKRADSGTRIRPGMDSPRGAYVATVLANRAVCTDHYRLTLALAQFTASAAGQFVQVDCRDHGAEETEGPRSLEWPAEERGKAGGRPVLDDPDFAKPTPYLRRPFSIADHRVMADGTAELDIIHRVVGRGTTALARLQPGRQVSLLGPLGVGFRVPADLQVACLVGGGVGVPPMLYLARTLAGRGCRRVAFFGAQRGDLLPVRLSGVASAEGAPMPIVAELDGYDCPAAITTDDGSLGMKGLVTQALRQYLAAQKQPNTVVYCCGPTPMMKAVARVAAELGVVCQASLEQPMACGMGTCQSCIIRYRPHTAPAGTEWVYKLTCTDGPVFDTRDLVW